MNKQYKKSMDIAIKTLNDIYEHIDTLKQIEEIDMDEMPEFAQESALYESMEEECDNMEDAMSYISDAIDSLKEIKFRAV